MENRTEKQASNMPPVPYIVHEGIMARQERTIKRLWILCIVIFIALVATNAGWIYYEQQFTDEIITEEIEQDVDTGNGDANVNGHIGDNYGKSETDNQKDNKTESP
jgi:hypothetical protein